MPHITQTVVQKAEIMDKIYYIWDDQITGFGLKVIPNGKKKFVLRYYHSAGGRKASQRFYLFGESSFMTAQIAREKAAELLLRVKNGEDPQEKKIEYRECETLEDFWNNYFVPFYVPKHRNPENYLKNNKSYWEHDIKPKLGHKKLLDLTGKDFEILHIAKANTPYGANRMLALASILCKLIRKERGLSISVEGIEHYHEEARQRILTDKEMDSLKAELIMAMNRGKDMIYTVSAIKVILMATARKNEILTGKWSNLDWERKILFQPESKTGWKPIYLNATVIKILKKLYERPERELNDYIFKGKGYVFHLKSVKTAWGTMLKNAGIKDYRIHDLRHQGASICVENGESLYIVSKMLGHKSQRTTERYAYLSKMPIQKATELLADVVDF